MHLAAFASLEKSGREKIIDEAPAVLSCDVKGQGSIKQPDLVAPLAASLLNIGSSNKPQTYFDWDKRTCP